MSLTWTLRHAVRTALARLGIRQLVLSIHQASFPPADDDIGYGTPYSERSGAMLEWLSGQGFTGLALGPAGITSRPNPSPYDATVMSRNPLHIALRPLCASGLLDERLLAAAVANQPAAPALAYDYAWVTQRRLLAAVAAGSLGDAALSRRLAQLQEAAPWLRGETRFEALAAAVGNDDWRRWPPAPSEDAGAARAFSLSQLLLREQHAAFRDHAHRLGMCIFGDLPIGISHRGRFLFRDLFLPGYAMGAPPSRTNPEGQPWGYPVLDPKKLEPGGAAWRYAAMRLDAVLYDHDGLRVDHPHGWVCPWVYRTDDPDPLHAVQQGARLYESPDLPDHPGLAACARVRPGQLDRSRARHADDWVRELEPSQVDRYAQTFDLIVQRLRAHGDDPRDLMVEVLSTCPRPLAEVLTRHELGRFRVTQKADVENAQDVYRSDRARPEDWIMVGNHDTPPLRAVLDRWHQTGEVRQHAAYLAGRLELEPARQANLAAQLSRDDAALTTAMFADLFLGPARNVLIFWVDLWGLREVYNRPGVIDSANWRLRVPADFDRAYAAARGSGHAPDLARALAWALRARRLDRDAEGRSLAEALAGRPDCGQPSSRSTTEDGDENGGSRTF